MKKYKVTVLCPWHEITAGGFDTALDAYEYVAQVHEISRDDVIRISIERYDPIEEAKGKPEVI